MGRLGEGGREDGEVVSLLTLLHVRQFRQTITIMFSKTDVFIDFKSFLLLSINFELLRTLNNSILFKCIAGCESCLCCLFLQVPTLVQPTTVILLHPHWAVLYCIDVVLTQGQLEEFLTLRP